MNAVGYSLGLYEKATPSLLAWEDRCTAAKDNGFDFVEISIDETDERLERLKNRALQEDILNASRRTGVPIRTMCLSGHRKFPFGASDPAARSRSLEIMGDALNLALFLGVRCIQLAGYDVYYEDSSEKTRADFAANLRVAVHMAARCGVTLGFETMETPFMDTARKAMAYVHAVNSPYLQVYPDLGNQTNAAKIYGYSVPDDIASAKGHIVAAHLKETRPGHYREVPFGDGHVDFINGAAAFLQSGVRMFVGEFWHIGAAEWEQDVRQASAFLREHLNAAWKVAGLNVSL